MLWRREVMWNSADYKDIDGNLLLPLSAFVKR